MTSFRLLLICSCSAFVLAACGGDTSSPGAADAADDTDNTSDCAAICDAKVAECGTPPGSEDPCPMLCASLTTEGELSCLAQSSCLELAEDFERGEVPCDGESGTQADCNLDDPPRCEGNAVVTCVDIAGMPTPSTETCGMYEACEDGACVSTLECLPLDARDCDALNDGSGPGQCCEGTVCFGEIDSSGEQYHRCCVQVDSGDACTEDADCCGHNPDNEFTPRCVGNVCTF